MAAIHETIFVRLLDEGIDCWRPVQAEVISPALARIDSRAKVPETETWEFPPGATVKCAWRVLDGGITRVAYGLEGAEQAKPDLFNDGARRRVVDFCLKWKIEEFAIFGSLLTDDFGPSSDIDVLVTFAVDAPWSYWEWPDMIADLEKIFGRKIDLVEKKSVTNPFRRDRILNSYRVVYAAA